ncbi:mannosyltransferase [Tepiditoga spiralis]|uniref:Mannosyltransferase n=1 Tax=Tepiditoga spiralis TaxID=2108365 RepID=A0A7G1G1Q2_9BACT|nr:glycosyltransferase [Tepiditoga spiralis]BBE30181.1 mannosyltransferase [Tepiditoga spiralis]
MENTKKVITSIGKYYYPTKGGIEKVTKDIAEVLAKDGYVSKVISFDGKKHKSGIINNVDIIRFKELKIGPAPISIKFLKIFNNLCKDSDVLIFHYPNPIAEYALLKYKGNAKIIIFYHSDLIGYNGLITKIYNKMTDKVLNKADVIIGTSPNYVKSSKNLKKYEDKTKILPLCVNHGEFETDKLYDFKNFNFKNKILFVGRFVKYKGINYLIDSLKYLDKSYGLIIVGSGKLKNKIKEQIKENDLKERVLMLENLSNGELKSVYNSSDVFVLPSILKSEAYGIVSLEAMANKLPIITTELGTGTSFYNVDGFNGKVIEPKSSKAIAEAVKICIKNKNEYGINGYQKVRQEFSLDVFNRTILEILKEL